MSKYLKLFETSAAYTAAESTLDKPNVSYIVETNGVEYKPYVPPRPTQIITYEASAKLSETTTTNPNANGLRTNAFSGTSGQLTMTNHTFENGVGTIEFDGDVIGIGEYAFGGCSGPTSITIPDSVTSIGGNAFVRCTGLTNVEIPDSVISIGQYAFGACKSLTNITIGSGVTSIGQYAFNNCTSLQSVTIGSGVTSIGQYAFQSCTSLTSVTIPDSVTSIGENAFKSCSGLTSIVVDSANTIYDSRNNCNAIIKTSTNELIAGCKNTVIPDTVTSIGRSAFSNCSGLTSITIPNSVTSIGDRAFQECSGLTSITCNATTAPTIKTNTFNNVNTGGTLRVPTGSTGYNVWMGTGNYYLGKYNWTKVEQ